MISLNLLSPAEKTKVTQLQTYFFLKYVAARLIGLVLIVSIAFVLTYMLLLNNSQTLDGQLTTEASLLKEGKATSLEEATKQLNQQLAMAKTMQDTFIQWPNFLSDFVSAVPDTVKLNSVQFNSTTLSFRITGRATDRSALLLFQENLKKSTYLANIVSPISDLAQKQNIDFDITGQLTKAIYD